MSAKSSTRALENYCPTPLPAVKASPSRHHSTSSTGPRPLQLVDANASSESFRVQLDAGPATAPLSRSSSSPTSAQSLLSQQNTRHVRSTTGTSRRQSSISYLTGKEDLLFGHGLTRHSNLSRSVSAKSTFKFEDTPTCLKADRRKTTGCGGLESTSAVAEPSPRTLTIMEKHADLLRFIAQKESKCLELRSQLAMHEAELAQLKRQWERIVNRGMERSSGVSDYNILLGSNHSTALQGGVVLEGIKEGVQGVSRLIAAGLSDLSAPSSSPVVRPLASASSRVGGHPTRQSNSSVSTSLTAASESTRMSLSSVSSVGDEFTSTPVISHVDSVKTPPNGPRSEKATPSAHKPSFLSADQEAKSHRRNSKDHSQSHMQGSTQTSTSSSTVIDIASTSSTSAPSLDFSRSQKLSPRARENPREENVRRASASMASLSSLSAVAGSVQPMPAWVENMGKKWDELQRSAAFTKSQKRASVLFTDVSQTIMSALGSPPMAFANILSEADATVSDANETLLGTTGTQSLLDEDEEETLDGSLSFSNVMTPDSKSGQALPRTVESHGSQPPSAKNDPSSMMDDDDDDEWNW